jgi:hypothetical protein
VVREKGLTHLQGDLQLAHAVLAIPQHFQNAKPVLVGQRV